ncbi:hypothetical protein T484DRAFT_1840115, partial [Baffinella frigidus]
SDNGSNGPGGAASQRGGGGVCAVGLALGRRKGGGAGDGAGGGRPLVVLGLAAGGPAEASGLLNVGDEVVMVDGFACLMEEVHTVAARLAGEEDAPVRLRINKGNGDVRSVTLIRRPLGRDPGRDHPSSSYSPGHDAGRDMGRDHTSSSYSAGHDTGRDMGRDPLSAYSPGRDHLASPYATGRDHLASSHATGHDAGRDPLSAYSPGRDHLSSYTPGRGHPASPYAPGRDDSASSYATGRDAGRDPASAYAPGRDHSAPPYQTGHDTGRAMGRDPESQPFLFASEANQAWLAASASVGNSDPRVFSRSPLASFAPGFLDSGARRSQ